MMSLHTVGLSLLIFTVNNHFNNELSTLQNQENKILNVIQSSVHHYLNTNVGKLDINLMLGVSIMKGQLHSCVQYSKLKYNNNQNYITLMSMVNKLYDKFFENNLPDLNTTIKILDHHLWTSSRKIIHKSNISLPKGFNTEFIAKGDTYLRGTSDKCIRQMIYTCKMTADCVGPELTDDFSGYALTHQVLYLHIFKKMKCKGAIFQKVVKKIIHYKCSKIFNEAQYISNNTYTLKKYKDLFIEQIAICGMQNMVEFIHPEWFSIVSSKTNFGRIQQEKYHSSRESHLTGVSLAALGAYWKFICYKINTFEVY